MIESIFIRKWTFFLLITEAELFKQEGFLINEWFSDLFIIVFLRLASSEILIKFNLVFFFL
jgi:hypothetical protein